MSCDKRAHSALVPLPLPRVQSTEPCDAVFVIVSNDFVGSTKIKTFLQMFVGQCSGPFGVFECPCGCPCGCLNRSFASLAR